ncbi:MAG: TrmH family RNA methyltransferase [Myxococcota bacterium]
MPSATTRYRSLRCSSTRCGLCFPVAEGSALGDRCPACGAPTEATGEPYLTHGVRTVSDHPPGLAVGSVCGSVSGSPGGLRVEVLLDNVRSLRNVGSMFRTADGAGVAHLHLGGITPTPEHPKLAKTSLGAERSVPWSRAPDACAAAADLRARGRRLWALEGGPRSTSLFDPQVATACTELREKGQGLVLVLGHEVSGVDPRIVDQCERVLHLPMLGHKDSLNVSVTLGVAAYWLRFGSGG